MAFNEYSDNATFPCIEMGIHDIDLIQINPDDTNNDNDDPETVILITFLAWRFKFEKRKALKNDLCEELILIVRYSRRWSNFFMTDDEQKEIDSIFTE